MSLSKVVVSGRVVKNPEKRFTPNTNVAGQRESTAVKVITWRDLAERCANDVKKGDIVTVDGRLQISQYTTPEGQKRRQAEIDAVSVETMSELSETGSAQTQVAAKTPAGAGVAASNSSDDLDAIFASEDEIPF
jgi:single-strand DNA-binding protein